MLLRYAIHGYNTLLCSFLYCIHTTYHPHFIQYSIYSYTLIKNTQQPLSLATLPLNPPASGHRHGYSSPLVRMPISCHESGYLSDYSHVNVYKTFTNRYKIGIIMNHKLPITGQSLWRDYTPELVPMRPDGSISPLRLSPPLKYLFPNHRL